MTAPRELAFVKMEGAGNDYVYVDGVHQDVSIELAASLAQRVADRHFGIGGDGLILLARSTVADCRMVMWNADGSRGRMCGNGLRCLAKLAHDTGVVGGPHVAVETDSGVLDVELLVDPAGDVIGARVPMPNARVDAEPRALEVAGRTVRIHTGDTGNPHAVVFVEEPVESAPVAEVGAALQRHPAFPDGVNVEFVRVEGPSTIRQRTFERGAGETLACGTGATIAALAAVRTGRVRGPIVSVRLNGGELRIHVGADGPVMEGPARTVFAGRLVI